MYRLQHIFGDQEITPTARFETLNEAIDEARKRIRYPETPRKGEISIDRSEDGKILRRWHQSNHDFDGHDSENHWRAVEPKEGRNPWTII